ncbi:MAG: RagB/SusD family nutrient uptake outer membrane protein [Tannerellaceae bacterium]|nr:RagB/SusD family nutrient uptake outer membrane protein [Tannerellaceae bacterium]
MKIKIYTLLLFFSLIACVDLNEEIESKQSSNQFYRNGADAIAAVNAIYAGLNPSGQSLYNSLFQIGVEMATDDFEAGPRARNAHVRAISGLTHDPSNDRMEQLWLQSYEVINLANIAVDRIAQIDEENITEELRNRTIREAKFLRALNYFNLVRWFGEIPLILHEIEGLSPEELYVSQSTEEEVYQQIIQDLKDAESLPAPDEYDNTDSGRATAGSAKSLLAKVYLTREAWDLAEQKSKEVIDSGWYGLFEDYADVFNPSTKNGKEHIFSAQFKGYSNFVGNSLASRSAPTNDEVPGVNGDYADALHRESGLYESFSKDDQRKAVTFVSEMVSPTDGEVYTFEVHLHKYYDPSAIGNQSNSSKNLPIIRYSEILLIYAEARSENRNGPDQEAYQAIDAIRRRAGIPTLQETAPNLSATQFRDSVFQERRKELVFEYQRWFDLVRRGADYYVGTLKAAGKTNAAPPPHSLSDPTTGIGPESKPQTESGLD